MKKPSIHAYLRALRWRLWIAGLGDRKTLAEIESHLFESVQDGLEHGLDQQEAEFEALRRFGEVNTIVSTFAREGQVPMQYLLLALGAAAGLFITYVDSRPGWDDTGITVGLLFLCAGALTLLGFRKPWLMALAVGIWLPAYYIYRSHDYLMLIVLLIPFVGAYLGWAVRLGLKKLFRPA